MRYARALAGTATVPLALACWSTTHRPATQTRRRFAGGSHKLVHPRLRAPAQSCNQSARRTEPYAAVCASPCPRRLHRRRAQSARTRTARGHIQRLDAWVSTGPAGAQQASAALVVGAHCIATHPVLNTGSTHFDASLQQQSHRLRHACHRTHVQRRVATLCTGSVNVGARCSNRTCAHPPHPSRRLRRQHAAATLRTHCSWTRQHSEAVCSPPHRPRTRPHRARRAPQPRCRAPPWLQRAKLWIHSAKPTRRADVNHHRLREWSGGQRAVRAVPMQKSLGALQLR